MNWFRVHSWLSYGWKTVWFWCYFHSFHENEEQVMLKIWLLQPAHTIFLCMPWQIQTKVGLNFCWTQERPAYRMLLNKNTNKFACIFHFAEKSFSVFNRAPSHTLKVFFCKIFYYFFNVHKTCVLYQFNFLLNNTQMLSHNIFFFYFCKFNVSDPISVISF